MPHSPTTDNVQYPPTHTYTHPTPIHLHTPHPTLTHQPTHPPTHTQIDRQNSHTEIVVDTTIKNSVEYTDRTEQGTHLNGHLVPSLVFAGLEYLLVFVLAAAAVLREVARRRGLG